MDINKLINRFEDCSIDENESGFEINQEVQVGSLYYITEVKLNFYQIWALFNTLPVVNLSGKCKYEWRFTNKENDDVFVICDWKNDKSLLQVKKWSILSTTLDDVKIGKFLKNLCDALECYNRYYKQGIESHTFISENPMVNSCLQDIKRSLFDNKEILKTL